MILEFKGIFEPISINTELLSLNNSRITDVTYASEVLFIHYSGIPSSFVLDQIKDTLDRHNPTPDAVDALKNLTRKAMIDLSIGAETSKQIGWIVKDFNDDLESIRSAYTSETAQELLDSSYSAWRITYDGLATIIKNDIFLFTAFFNDPSGYTFAEPDPVTNDYKVWFNVSIRDFLEYVTDRLQM